MGYPLKYLFKAHYDDGGVFVQNEGDVSSTGIGSAFTDVEPDRLHKFMLEGGGHSFGVDLRDGSFLANGLRFQMHDTTLNDIRLHYFRKVRHQFDGNGCHLGIGVTYLIGWTAFDERGDAIERVMEVE